MQVIKLKFCRAVLHGVLLTQLLYVHFGSCFPHIYSSDHIAAHSVSSVTDLISHERNLGLKNLLHFSCYNLNVQGNDEGHFKEISRFRGITTRRVLDEEEACIMLHGHENDLRSQSRCDYYVVCFCVILSQRYSPQQTLIDHSTTFVVIEDKPVCLRSFSTPLEDVSPCSS